MGAHFRLARCSSILLLLYAFTAISTDDCLLLSNMMAETSMAAKWKDGDCCAWPGVSCVFTSTGVTEYAVVLENSLSGVLRLELPRTTTKLVARQVSLAGTLDTAQLPPTLRELKLTDGSIPGTIDLTTLPEAMEIFTLSSQQLRGTVDLSRLPQGLLLLDLSHNQLTGSFNLSTLPRSLTMLLLRENLFSASINADILRNLPPNLYGLDLSDNRLTGTLDLSVFEGGYRCLKISQNRLSFLVGVLNQTRCIGEFFLNANPWHCPIPDLSTAKWLNDGTLIRCYWLDTVTVTDTATAASPTNTAFTSRTELATLAGSSTISPTASESLASPILIDTAPNPQVSLVLQIVAVAAGAAVVFAIYFLLKMYRARSLRRAYETADEVALLQVAVAPPVQPANGGPFQRTNKMIGRGGYAVVWLGVDLSSGKAVALKEMTGAAELASEAALLCRLRHPCVVQCLGVLNEGSRSFLALEYLVGGAVTSLLQRHRCGLPLSLLRRILRDALTGLEFLHLHRVVHRDIKPSNLLLDSLDHLSCRCKLADFGLAHQKQSESIDDPSVASRVAGTFAYLSPEAARERHVSTPGDIWAIGMTCLHLLTGSRPWPSVENPTLLLAQLLLLSQNSTSLANVDSNVSGSDSATAGSTQSSTSSSSSAWGSQKQYPLPCDLTPSSTDFLRCCLWCEPENRWTATALLSHPFLTKPEDPEVGPSALGGE
eukprot:TRINITY_DN7933_c0_g1_i1.p1 TRINITY_DN7933_c0_g1~~TRINITY_DN7933_c0_g1_i1.p1  ORF type:complete len:723 (-),score=72.64 TRINITY_DN7933_c0_g1_i1:99-2237(-)